ncbi:MAG TPA: 4a-hydroxytetrahydrobiopterin dehydratase [Thermoanaerobaculia bacterium]|nr:4a-hydroxytetrahydrobiopterin dehydratase [Thermoanaerobaculia bacterium]
MGPPVDVTLYTRRDCHLCDKAKAAMRASGIDVRIEEIDIDNDPELRRRYANDVPVVCIGGAEVFRHRITPDEFARLVRDRQASAASQLAKENCIPCRGGVPPLKGEELQTVVGELGGTWRVVDEHHLEKEFRFPDFEQALSYTNAVGAVAEREGHHPDIHLAWGKVRIEIWTHKIDGLTRSDFILAAKIDRILPA